MKAPRIAVDAFRALGLVWLPVWAFGLLCGLAGGLYAGSVISRAANVEFQASDQLAGLAVELGRCMADVENAQRTLDLLMSWSSGLVD